MSALKPPLNAKTRPAAKGCAIEATTILTYGAAQGLDAKAEDNYFTAKEIAEAASLPIHLFRDQAERNRKRVPHLMLVGNLRFSLPAILEWEMANSVVGGAATAVSDEAESPAAPLEPAKRWHELVREQDGARFDSAPSS